MTIKKTRFKSQMPTEVIQRDVPAEGDAPEEERRPPQRAEGSSSSDGEDGAPPVLCRQTSVQRELADAVVRLAPISELKILLEVGAEIDEPVTQGLRPLHYAVWQRYPEAVQFFIDEGKCGSTLHSLFRPSLLATCSSDAIWLPFCSSEAIWLPFARCHKRWFSSNRISGGVF